METGNLTETSARRPLHDRNKMKPSTRENLKSLMIGLAALAGLILWLKYQPQPPADRPKRGGRDPLSRVYRRVAPHHLTIVRPKPEKETVEAVEIRLERERKDGKSKQPTMLRPTVPTA